MKKLVLIALLSLSTLGNTDTLFGVYAGVQTWIYNNDIDLRANNDVFDAFESLSKNSKNSQSLFIALEHGVPLIPNVKLKHSNFEVQNFSSRINGACTLQFPNICFPSTDIDLSHTDLTLYYELLDNWVNLDLGLSAIYFGGQVDFDTGLDADINYSKIVPALYGKASFELPVTDLSVSLTANLGSFSSASIIDIELAAAYKLALGFSIEAGLRQQTIDLEGFNGTDVHSNATGIFTALNFHF